MKVNVPVSLVKLQSLPDFHLGIYLHEYIHFIQDISTTFGLMNSCITVDYLKFACHEILNSPGKDFFTPVLPRVGSSNHVHINFELRKIYQGCTDIIERITIRNIRKSFKNINFPDRSRHVPYIEVKYKNSFLPTDTFIFGSCCLMESMAYLEQSIIFKDSLPVPEVPYLSAEIFIRELYPELLRDNLNILALCDAALGAYNPGPFFFDAIVNMKTEKWLPKEPQDIYTYCYSQESCYGDNSSSELLLLDAANNAIKQLGDYFTIDIFKDNKDWIEYIIKTATNLRKSIPTFILDIALGGHLIKNEDFINLFKAVGTPMITNMTNEGTFYCPIQERHEIVPQLFWAINQILCIFLFGQRNCELKNFCQQSSYDQNILDYTDKNCDKSPWEKAKEKQLCPFGRVWRMWGLTDKVPT